MAMNPGEIRIDALLPPEMALRAEYLGVRKAEAPLLATFTLSLLAGAFISLGAVFSTTVAAGASGVVPYGMVRLLPPRSTTASFRRWRWACCAMPWSVWRSG